MIERSRMQLDFRSDNLKSKIQNLKWGWVVAVVVAFTTSGAVGQAQQAKKVPRVGILFIGGRDQPHLEAFKQGLRERGYTEGKNIVLDYRYAEGDVDRLTSLATELVQLKVDVIVTTSGNSARAATQATKTIPIVLTTGADPVKSGLAESLAKPGRNITGLSIIEEDLSGKRMEILKETFSKNDAIGVPLEPPCRVLFGGRPRRAATHRMMRQKKQRKLLVYSFFPIRYGLWPIYKKHLPICQRFGPTRYLYYRVR